VPFRNKNRRIPSARNTGLCHNTWQKVLSALLRQAAKEGAIASAAKADDLAALIVATLKGLFMLPAEGRDPKEVDRQLRALERLIAQREVVRTAP
jgi:hypothetical protein